MAHSLKSLSSISLAVKPVVNPFSYSLSNDDSISSLLISKFNFPSSFLAAVAVNPDISSSYSLNNDLVYSESKTFILVLSAADVILPFISFLKSTLIFPLIISSAIGKYLSPFLGLYNALTIFSPSLVDSNPPCNNLLILFCLSIGKSSKNSLPFLSKIVAVFSKILPVVEKVSISFTKFLKSLSAIFSRLIKTFLVGGETISSIKFSSEGFFIEGLSFISIFFSGKRLRLYTGLPFLSTVASGRSSASALAAPNSICFCLYNSLPFAKLTPPLSAPPIIAPPVKLSDSSCQSNISENDSSLYPILTPSSATYCKDSCNPSLPACLAVSRILTLPIFAKLGFSNINF